MEQEVAAARRVLSRLSPKAFVELLSEEERDGLREALRGPAVLRRLFHPATISIMFNVPIVISPATVLQGFSALLLDADPFTGDRRSSVVPPEPVEVSVERGRDELVIRLKPQPIEDAEG